MRTIYLEMGAGIEERDVDRLIQTLPHLRNRDRLEITMEAADAHQADRVMGVLQEHGFDFQPKGSSEGTFYKVSAWRRKTLC